MTTEVYFDRSNTSLIALLFVSIFYTSSLFSATLSPSLYCYTKSSDRNGGEQLRQCSRNKKTIVDHCVLDSGSNKSTGLNRYFCSTGAGAQATIGITIGDIDQALDNALDGSPLEKKLVSLIEQEIREAGLTLTDSGLEYSADLAVPNSGNGDCNRVKMRNFRATATLLPETGIHLDIDSLDAPIITTIRLKGKIKIKGNANHSPKWYCVINLPSTNVRADVDADLQVTATLKLNPVFNANSVSVTPKITLLGDLKLTNIKVNVSNDLLKFISLGQLERILTKETKKQLGKLNLDEQLAQAELKFNTGQGTRTFPVPDLSGVQLGKLFELVNQNSLFEVSFDYIKAHQSEVLIALLTKDKAEFQNYLQNGLMCGVLKEHQENMPATPIYQRVSSGFFGPKKCKVRTHSSGSIFGLPDTIKTTYLDSSCSGPSFKYRRTSLQSYCNVTLDESKLGDATSPSLHPDPNPNWVNTIQMDQALWTRNPGTSIDVNVEGLDGLSQPYMAQYKYLSVLNKTDFRGNRCDLEMRVYSKTPPTGKGSLAGLKPMLFIHGGGWNGRSFSVIGLESEIAAYTNAGFLVFEPFYQLVGTNGPAGCGAVNHKRIEIDLEAALKNAYKLSAYWTGVEQKTAVAGHSAGAQLATYLAASRSVSIRSKVSGVIAFYGPHDMREAIQQIKDGRYTNSQGEKLISGYIGKPIAEIDVNSFEIDSLSFPARVARAPNSYPPMFLIHGSSDTLVPSDQSVRMCNAYTGSVDTGPAIDDGGDPAAGVYRKTYSCANSRLHLIAEGEHGMDAKIFTTSEAGSQASQDALAKSMKEAREWLKNVSVH